MGKLKVLFVDDEGELVNTVLERLHFRGVAAKGATGAEEALELVRRERFDVVLLDVKMPGLDGLGMIKILKREHPHLPVIFLTGHGSKEDAEEGLRSGAFEYLMKPIDLDRLLELIARATEPRRETEGAELAATTPARADLAFIGRVVAEQSHEVTNALNTMNEVLGLARDTVVSQLGAESDARQRLELLLQRIDRQLRRGVAVVRSLNRFGHVMDAGAAKVDVGAAVDHTLALLERRARFAKVRLEREGPTATIEITTVPVLLHEALHLCIGAMIPSAPGAGSVAVAVRGREGWVAISVRGERPVAPTADATCARGRLRLILDELGGRICRVPEDDPEGRLEFHLPSVRPKPTTPAPVSGDDPPPAARR